MTKEEVIEKVKKILSKADKSTNSSQGEVEVALEMAHVLLKKHHLSMSHVMSFDDKKNGHSSIDLTEQIGASFKAPSVPKWMSILISAVNQITQTRNLIRYGKPEGKKQYGDLHISFVGDQLDVEVASELFNFLRNSITKLASKYCRENKKDFQHWRSFAEGCACKLLAKALKTENHIWSDQKEFKEDKCCVDNFVINDEDEDDYNDEDDEIDDDEERAEEKDLDVDNFEMEDTVDNVESESYALFLVTKKKKIDDFINDFSKNHQKVEKEVIKDPKKLDHKSFDKGLDAGDQVPLKVLKQLKTNK